MYDELVRSLRICAEGEHCDKCTKWEAKQNGGLNVCLTALCKEAADAIEELAAFKAQITDGRFYVYKLGTLFELRHDPRELVVRHQDPTEPPKEET